MNSFPNSVGSRFRTPKTRLLVLQIILFFFITLQCSWWFRRLSFSNIRGHSSKLCEPTYLRTPLDVYLFQICYSHGNEEWCRKRGSKCEAASGAGAGSSCILGCK